MRIAFVEISNFRKLKDIRIDLHKETTLLVGANNSGKTSAMLALRYFLRKRGGFGINDFTLCHRKTINEIGRAWLANTGDETSEPLRLTDWENVLPALDVWLEAKNEDLHYVSHILPSIDWSGGRLGVRLRLQPVDLTLLYREFLEAVKRASEAKTGAQDARNGKAVEVTLWPVDLVDFLSRRLSKHFKPAAFVLDPAKLVDPSEKSIAVPQKLEPDAEPLDGDPFEGLLQIDEIPAQRGLGDTAGTAGETETEVAGRKEARKLAKQFSDYFSKHLDPNDKPEAADVLALKAIEDAQKAYDDRLEISFSGPLREMESLGYPGVTDPRVKIRTRLKPVDGLNHHAAVQYEVTAMSGAAPAMLPEDYNGLGYQNLISMVFRLMSFRDAWMRVGKAKISDENASSAIIPPIHLILIEEPEAHLHVQVQQVFIRKAYGVLRKHDRLGASEQFATQLIVSTHSGHVAHEVEFSCIRYFRRLPAGYPGKSGVLSIVPISSVINLTDAFGDENETSRFAKRYLRATHCDLFFADAAIFVEGTAERILLPHFVRKNFEYLSGCYLTWLEVGGSHAHRLQPLIERLGIPTLIITDLDALDPANGRRATRPVRGRGLETRNTTLREWLPKEKGLDALLLLPDKGKVAEDGPLFAVRVAYQTEVDVARKGQTVRLCPYTFEDALALENLEAIGKLQGSGLVGTFSAAVNADSGAETLAQALYNALDSDKKAEFALDMLGLEPEPWKLQCPTYIHEALQWLEQRLRQNKSEVLGGIANAEQTMGAAVAGVSEPIQSAAMTALDEATKQASDSGAAVAGAAE